MKGAKLLVLVVAALLAAAFFALGGHRYLTFEALKAQQAAIQSYYAGHPWQTVAGFFLIYVVATALSFPGAATALTLAAGAIFGLLWGTVIVSFASSSGATLAYLASRFLFRDWVQQKFGKYLRTINDGVEKEGGFYLFTLRLIPAVPFFVINLAMGLTPIRAWTFYWVSQLGMLAGTIVYVNAGTQLAEISSPAGILSPGLIGAFVLLGIFPLIAKKIVDLVKARRVYARWSGKRPSSYDRNLVVIGAGSAGLVSSYIAAAVKAKVTLIERHRMGGDCLNTGCVPSKALIKTARVLATIRRAKEYGLKSASAEFDFAD
ncbi:MAG TPA: VTT domain-containing protein, partial [Burkholderiales bacterium]|nr:VTT domain-containing protein [Burkholderiales bacterium]